MGWKAMMVSAQCENGGSQFVNLSCSFPPTFLIQKWTFWEIIYFCTVRCTTFKTCLFVY